MSAKIGPESRAEVNAILNGDLGDIEDALFNLVAERDRYKAALEKIVVRSEYYDGEWAKAIAREALK